MSLIWGKMKQSPVASRRSPDRKAALTVAFPIGGRWRRSRRMRSSRSALCRLTALLLACALLFSLVSCGRDQGVDRPSGKTVMTVGGYAVSDAEYNYYLSNRQASGLDGAAAKEAAEKDIRRNIALIAMAADYDTGLNDGDRETVEARVADEEELMGSGAFAAELESMSLTREVYVYLSQLALLESLLREYVTDERSGVLKYDDAAVLEDVRVNFIAVKQVLIPASGDGTADKAKAEAALAALNEGEDFDAVAARYGPDEAADPTYGRYFTSGMYPAAFEEAAKKLAVGELSGIVATEVGYHIILRVAEDDGYINQNFEQLRYIFLNRCFNELLETKMNSLEVVYK